MFIALGLTNYGNQCTPLVSKANRVPKIMATYSLPESLPRRGLGRGQARRLAFTPAS
jgi:hypothetical protein